MLAKAPAATHLHIQESIPAQHRAETQQISPAAKQVCSFGVLGQLCGTQEEAKKPCMH